MLPLQVRVDLGTIAMKEYSPFPKAPSLESCHLMVKCQCQSEDRFIFILIKTKHPIHIMMFRVVTSNDNVMTPFIFPHDVTLKPQAYIKYLEKVVLSWIKREGAGRPSPSTRTLHYATQVREPNLGCQKISVITSPLTSDCLTLQIVIPWLFCMRHSWTRVQQNSVQSQRWTEHKDNGSICQFEPEDCQKGLQEILKSFGVYGWSHWWFL